MSLPVTVPPEAVEETPIGAMPAGTRLGNYELGRLLGRGGMGAVYEGRHRGVNKRVAIKILLPHLAASKSSTQRFLREAEAAGRVRHPHTVDVTDVGVSDGIPFIVMELLDGENLADRLEKVGPLPVDAVVDLALPVCSALATAHDEGVVHRDLKPENVFLARTAMGSEVVKVLDFGISHIAQGADDVRLTATNSVIGTPRYMSPEQTRGARNADARSDQYSVGVMLYQCLTGSLPFDGDSFLEILEKMANRKIVPPSELRDGIPGGLEAIVMRTLAKDPKKRFASMRELGVALLPFSSDRGRVLWEPAFAPEGRAPSEAHALVLQRDTTVRLRTERPRRTALLLGLAVLVCLALGLAGAWRFRTEPGPVVASPLPAPPSPGPSPGPTPAPAPAPAPTIPVATPAADAVRPVDEPAATVEPRPSPRPRDLRPTPAPRREPSTRPPPDRGERDPAPIGPNGAAILR